jgi:hypothetical protein
MIVSRVEKPIFFHIHEHAPGSDFEYGYCKLPPADGRGLLACPKSVQEWYYWNIASSVTMAPRQLLKVGH